MATRHLSCPACRIRVRADAPELAVLEDRCPLCGATLRAASPAADVMGFRSFDLDELSEQESDGHANPSGNRADPGARREAASAQSALDARRWEDDGGSIAGEAEAKW
jgi:hypothetical protein